MLSIFTYESQREIVNHFDDHEGVLVVAPGPKDADSIRLLMGSNFNVITISKFIKDNLSPMSVTKKTDLLVHLGAVWKSKTINRTFSDFYHLFELFTELRSYSLDQEIALGLTQNISQASGNHLRLFSAYLEATNTIDEQKAYRLLGEKFARESGSFKKIVFWGFQNITSAQVDLLKDLSVRHDVIIPYPALLYLHKKKTDWISWLSLEEIDIQLSESFKGRVLTGKRDQLDKFINKSFSENKYEQLILMNKDSSYEQFTQFHVPGLNFKSNTDVFKHDLNGVIQDLKLDILRNGPQKADKILSKLKTRAALEINKENKVLVNYRFLKVIALVINKIENMINLSSHFEILDEFELGLLEKVTSLDIPRLRNMVLSDSSQKAMDVRDYFPAESSSLVIGLSSFTSMNQVRPRDDLDYHQLATIGPIANNNMDIYSILSKLYEGLKDGGHDVIFEDTLLELNIHLNDFMKSFNLEPTHLDSFSDALEAPQVFKDHLASHIIQADHILESLSASKIQSFIDCKRKYYFNYISSINLDDSIEQELLPREIGQLEHKIIELYYKEKLSMSDLDSLCERELCKNIRETKKKIDPISYRMVKNELITYASNGIVWLENLTSSYPSAKLHFESNVKELTVNNKNFKGKIDCLIEFEECIGIIDFKRSGGSIPTAKDITSYENVQLATYMLCSPIEKPIAFGGFFCLSEPEISLMFLEGNKLDLSLGKHKKLKVSSETYIKAYNDFLIEKISEIENEKYFPITVKNESKCRYCNCNYVCPKVPGGQV